MKITSYAYTALAIASLATSASAGCSSSDKVDVEVCIKTDDWPGETSLIIDNADDETVLEMDGFSRSGKVYCEDVRLCSGKNWLLIEDSNCDGLGHSYGEVIIRTRKSKIMDKTLNNFGCEYGWRKFDVPRESSGGGGGCTGSKCGGGGVRGGGGGGGRNGPFGSRNCRECKDECADRNSGDSWGKKRCKTDICRAHYGKSACKD